MKPLALFALALLAPQAPTTLRVALKADAVDTYKIEDKVTETVKSAMGEMPLTIGSTRTYVLKTTKVDEGAGTARFEATTTVDKLDATGPAAAMAGEKPKPTTQAGKIDVRGRMTYDPAPASDPLAGLLSGVQGAGSAGTFVEFPEKAVKIGDAWDIVVPKNPYVYGEDQRLTATLTGERELDGKPVWVVAVKGTLRTAVDTTKLPPLKGGDPASNIALRLLGQVDLTGEGLVDKASGKTVSMTSKGIMKMTIDLADSGLKLDANGTIESVMKLQKG